MNRMKKILLQGYYGFGNLGDDILLKVTHDFIRKEVPGASISVLNNADKKQSAYLASLLDENVECINYSARQHFDLIVHGGGGVHYDFDSGNWKFGMLNRVIGILGVESFLRVFNAYKRLKNAERITTNFRMGLGIGVGTFTRSSKRYYSNLPILGDYDCLLVRDEGSLREAKKINRKAIIRHSTDLAFLTDSWKPEVKRLKKSTLEVGVVLRHWKYDHNHILEVVKAMNVLQNKGIGVKFFSFEKSYDQPYISLVQNSFEVHCWDPHAQSFNDFFSRFANTDLILTTRFHGAILASAFSIPSVYIQIEPKLATLSQLLPTSSVPLPVKSTASEIEKRISATLQGIEELIKSSERDFRKNQALISNDVRGVASMINRLQTESTVV